MRADKAGSTGTVSKKDQARPRGGPGLILPFLHGVRWAPAIQQRLRVCRTSHPPALDKREDDAEVVPSRSPLLPAQGGVQAWAGFSELGPPLEHPQPTRTQNHRPVSRSQLE